MECLVRELSHITSLRVDSIFEYEIAFLEWNDCLLPRVGRKSGKGCYVYGAGKKTVNEEAAKILDKYRVPINGR